LDKHTEIINEAVIQFASSSVHLAASFEVLASNNPNRNKYYYYWGSETLYPWRMARELESFKLEMPLRIRKIIESLKLVYETNQISSESINLGHKFKNLNKMVNKIETVTDLSNLELEGNNVGKYIMNEITFITRDVNFKVSRNLALINLIARSYLEIYWKTIDLIDSKSLDHIYVYNGRFIHERAVIDAAKNANVSTAIFETMRNRILVRSEGFHNRLINQKYMSDHWNNSPEPLETKILIGSKYFEDLRGGNNPFKTELPIIRNSNKNKYFVYFSSSDDEVAGLWDIPAKNLGSQINCVRKLQEIFDKQDDYTLIIRIHPNLRNKSRSQIKEWSAISNSKSSIVFDQNNQTSTYELLDNSIGTITFGSTLGLESVFALKPSLVLTDCGYDALKVVDKAENWEDVEKWILNISHLDPRELETRKINSCIRGYYLETAGINYLFSELRNTGWGTWEVESINGFKLRPGIFLKYRSLIISKIKILKWRLKSAFLCSALNARNKN
jgi:hypothetical protein